MSPIKIFVIVWHSFLGQDVNDGRILQFMAHPFKTQETCQVEIMKAMKKYDYDKQMRRNFYVDCMDFDEVPPGTPSI